MSGSNQECVFCRIASGQVKADRVLETEDVVAFRDLNPQAPTHILVIPRVHVASLNELEDPDLAGRVLMAARQVAGEEGLAEAGYRVVVNQGSDGGQTVFHLHVHVLGGRRMTWPPG